MGMKMPKTRWAVFQRQAIKLRDWCIWLVDLFEYFYILNIGHWTSWFQQKYFYILAIGHWATVLLHSCHQLMRRMTRAIVLPTVFEGAIFGSQPQKRLSWYVCRFPNAIQTNYESCFRVSSAVQMISWLFWDVSSQNLKLRTVPQSFIKQIKTA